MFGREGSLDVRTQADRSLSALSNEHPLPWRDTIKPSSRSSRSAFCTVIGAT
jgi:hypothetical protein